MKKISTILGSIVFTSIIISSCGKNSAEFPESTISYDEAEYEVGGHSTLSDDKQNDMFETKYENHWFTWEGEVVLAEADNASINIDGVGTQDLLVDFADIKAGYNLKKGDHIKVRFVMTSPGGSFLPFRGENAVIVP